MDNQWVKSSFCDNGDCVWVGRTGDRVLVRDANGETLIFDTNEWAAFLAGAKAGEFDVE